jgi:anti-sigma regulatory factor (Ser/Thr protein kinase)
VNSPRPDTPGAPSSRLHVPPDLAKLATVREWLGQVAEAAGLSESRAFDLKVVGSEAVANAIEHAESAVEIEAWLLSDRLIVEVTNKGVFQPGLSSDREQRRRGLGLPLMVSLADQVHVARARDDVTRVTFTFFLEAPSPAEKAVAAAAGGKRQPAAPGEVNWPPRALWLLLPLLAVAVIVLSILRLDEAFNPEGLFTTANIIFLTLFSFFVSVLAARSYLLGRSEAVLLMGCGTLALGLGALLAAVHAAGPDAKSIPAVYNTAALLAGLCHLGAAWWSRTERVSAQVTHRDLRGLLRRDPGAGGSPSDARPGRGVAGLLRAGSGADPVRFRGRQSVRRPVRVGRIGCGARRARP